MSSSAKKQSLKKITSFFSKDSPNLDSQNLNNYKKTKLNPSSKEEAPKNVPQNEETKVSIHLSKQERKICDDWFTDHVWLFLLKNGGLGCKYCIFVQASTTSPFSNGKGCFNFRKNALEDHQISSPHKRAQTTFVSEKTKDTKSLESFFNNRSQISSKSLTLLLNNIYFCAWHLRAIVFMEELNLYMKRCGFNVGNHYLDHNAARQMVIYMLRLFKLMLGKKFL